MHVPRECYPLQEAIDTSLAHLTTAQRRGLVWWVFGTLLAGSGCLSAVLVALGPFVGRAGQAALRQSLREWLRDGGDKLVPGAAQLEVATCFAPLLRWLLGWWRGAALPVALDVTLLRDRVAIVTLAVLYRGTAIPVAWHVTAANRQGQWLTPALRLIETLALAVPGTMPVLLLADRGLWSGRLWDTLRCLGWHPLLRVRPDVTFAPHGGTRVKAVTLVPGPGHAWVGTGVAFKHHPVRRAGTLVVMWDHNQTEPWLVLTDLAPTDVGVCWYGLRTWVELGFRSLKSFGWQWERTRRTDPDRVARHTLVLAIATLWTVATGTREEDAEGRGCDPDRVRLVLPPPPTRGRRTSLFARGLVRVRWQLLRTRRLWRQLWLWPDPWPGTPPNVTVIIHAPLPN